MSIFSFFKKPNPEKKPVPKINNRARYKLVTPPDNWQYEQGQIETKTEDGILDAYGRGRMINHARNATRNSSTFSAILKQFDLLGCGE